MSPVRDPADREEVELAQIDHVAIVAIRAPEGPLELRREDRVDPGLSVTNFTGEELLVSLFRDEQLVAEDRLDNDDTLVFGDEP